MREKVKNAIQKIFNSNLSLSDEQKIESAFAIKNIKSGNVLLPFVALFEGILIALSLLNKTYLNKKSLVYLICYCCLFVVTLIFFFISQKYSKNMEKSVKKVSFLTNSYSFLIILWSIIVSNLDLYYGGSAIVFLTVTMSIGCGFSFKVKEIMFLEITAYIIFFISAIVFAKIKGFGLLFNISVYLLILLLVSIIKSVESINLIKKSLIIEAKNLELERTSLYDKLTGIRNRWSLSLTLKKCFEVAQKENFNLVVAMFDLDNFKEINDTYGHSIGDECLISVSECLKKHTLEDNLFRYGGEEYTLIFMDKETKEITETLNNIRTDIQNKMHTDKKLKLTISGGALSMVPRQEVLAEDYLKIADRALYEAKANGKNLIIVKEI